MSATLTDISRSTDRHFAPAVFTLRFALYDKATGEIVTRLKIIGASLEAAQAAAMKVAHEGDHGVVMADWTLRNDTQRIYRTARIPAMARVNLKTGKIVKA